MSEFIEQLPDVFAKFGAITLRAMFGGHGIYHDGTMFALAANGMLYLKTDSGNAKFFEDLGLEQFEYVGKDGRSVRMSYHRAPDDLFENPAKAALWARRSLEAALRAHAKRPLVERPAFAPLPHTPRNRRY